jgi:hypothetical protein
VVVNKCWLCESDGESVNHLFLHCGATRALRDAFFTRSGLCWVMPSTIKDLYARWWIGGCSRSAVVWKIVSLCIMWCIWRERNDSVLRTSRGHMRSFVICSFLLFSLGLRGGWPRE